MFCKMLTKMMGDYYKNKSTLMTTQTECQQRKQNKTKVQFTLPARISFLKDEITKIFFLLIMYSY